MVHRLEKVVSQQPFAFLRTLRRRYPKAEVYLVGGMVRDALLGRPSKDYDFIIRHVPLATLQKFLATQGWVDLVGKRFGVLKFIPKQSSLTEPIDVALPRTEHAWGTGAYRDVNVQSDPRLPLAKDLERRDFTINSLAYDIFQKKLIDPFGGQNDLSKKTIRTVGKPAARFKEDYSRMLRGLRFTCQLGFAIEQETRRAITRLMPRVNRKERGEFIVPRETVAKEVMKSFTADPVAALDIYYKTSATAVLLPELLAMKGCPQPRNFHSEGDVWKHTRICLQNLYSKKFRSQFTSPALTPELIWAVLWHDVGKPYTIERKDRLRFNNHDTVGADLAKQVMERLKLASAGVDVDRVHWLIRHHLITTHSKKSPMKRTTLEKYFFRDPVRGTELLQLSFVDIMGTIPPSGQPDFSDYQKLKRQINRLRSMGAGKKLPPPLLDGHEIMKLTGVTPGPLVGEYITKVREAQLAGTIKTKPAAIAFLKRNVHTTR